MKIFVTGGAGFIGSHLCEFLLEKGHEVSAYDNLYLGREENLRNCRANSKFKFIKNDLLNLDDLMEALQGHELVFHLAANSDIQGGGEKTDTDLRLGTLATYSVLEAMRRLQIKELIFASSSAVYGETKVLPTPETFGPLLPISLYGSSKVSCETLCSAFSHNYGTNVWIYRFANIVGGHSTHGAIHDFVKRLRKDASRLAVLGDGKQKKSYLHVSDCVEGMYFGYQKAKETVNLYNLASEGTTQVKTIAEKVVEKMNLRCAIEFGKEDRGWKGDVPVTWLDSTRMKKLGWTARLSSDQAVERAVQDVVSEMSSM